MADEENGHGDQGKTDDGSSDGTSGNSGDGGAGDGSANAKDGQTGNTAGIVNPSGITLAPPLSISVTYHRDSGPQLSSLTGSDSSGVYTSDLPDPNQFIKATAVKEAAWAVDKLTLGLADKLGELMGYVANQGAEKATESVVERAYDAVHEELAAPVPASAPINYSRLSKDSSQ